MNALLEALRCPDDGAALSGEACSRCGRRFPEEDGIRSMLPSASPVPDVLSERAQRDREASLYDRILALRLLSVFEIPATLRLLQGGAGDRIVEVGCGTGRFSVHLARIGGPCFFLDHSLESLRILRSKLSPEEQTRVLLIQADAAQLPLADAWATRVLSAQMLEHLPGAEFRSRAMGEMARALAPGGRLVLSVYQHLPGITPREGRHSGEIYFYRFERPELRRLLKEAGLQVDAVTLRLVYILLAGCTRR
jgi:ubiquinone/menaquinone biosynthesis C-methylase UbiE